jgi:hypothetical protein
MSFVGIRVLLRLVPTSVALWRPNLFRTGGVEPYKATRMPTANKPELLDKFWLMPVLASADRQGRAGAAGKFVPLPPQVTD